MDVCKKVPGKACNLQKKTRGQSPRMIAALVEYGKSLSLHFFGNCTCASVAVDFFPSSSIISSSDCCPEARRTLQRFHGMKAAIGGLPIPVVRCSPFCKVKGLYEAYLAALGARSAYLRLSCDWFVLLCIAIESTIYVVSWREGGSNHCAGEAMREANRKPSWVSKIGPALYRVAGFREALRA